MHNLGGGGGGGKIKTKALFLNISLNSLVAILYSLGGPFVVAGLPEGVAARLQQLVVAVV